MDSRESWTFPSVVARVDFGGDNTSAELLGKDDALQGWRELSVPGCKLYFAVVFFRIKPQVAHLGKKCLGLLINYATRNIEIVIHPFLKFDPHVTHFYTEMQGEILL